MLKTETEHNQKVERLQREHWQTKPDAFTAYYRFPHEPQDGPYRATFYPRLREAAIVTWLGARIGTVMDARVYRHNFGARMVSVTVQGTNGAIYHGRASWDNGDVITLHRSRESFRMPYYHGQRS